MPSSATPPPAPPTFPTPTLDAPEVGGRIQSVERAARILLAFAAPEQQVTVAELSRMLGVHKSTASRLVATLVAYGLLARGEDDDQLRLGPELARLGRLAESGPDLVELAGPAMGDLSAVTGEGTTLAVAAGDGAETVAQHDGHFVIGMGNWVGSRAPLHATSDGKVLLAFGAATLPGSNLAASTDATIVDPARLLEELAAIRARGWATSLGEFELGLHGVAAPVMGSDGQCRAALCVSGPSYRLSATELDRVGALCRQAADRVSAALALRAAPRTEAVR